MRTSTWAMSEYGYRISHCLMMLRHVYEPNDALKWIASPQPLLSNRVPADLLETREGANEVEAMIMRILDGAYV